MSDTSLISFKSIATFTKDLAEMYALNQRSLKLYRHLINKTTIAHDKPIKKHIQAFRDFCVANRDAITTMDEKKFVTNRVVYSDRVYIDFKDIFKLADSQTKVIIWKHFLTISALVDPAGKAKEVLKNSNSGKEGDFLSDIITKVEKHVDPNANPMEAVNSIMKSGIFNDLIGGMNDGLQSGSLDLGKLMGTVQSMVTSLGEKSGDSEGGDQAMNVINTMIGSMMGGAGGAGASGGADGASGGADSGGGGMPDIASMMGPLLAGLTGGGGGAGSSGGMPDLASMMSGLMGGGGDEKSIEDRINAQVTAAKSSKPKISEVTEKK